MTFKFGRCYIKPWFNLEGIAGVVGQPGLQGQNGVLGRQTIVNHYDYGIIKKKFKFGR